MTTPAPGRLLALAFFIFAVTACSCAGILSIDYAFQTRPLVFTARVVGLIEPPPQFVTYNGKRVLTISGGDMVGWVTIPVQSWKGSLSDTVVVYSTRDGAACGYSFQIGRDYIIFATLEGKEGWHPGTLWPDGTVFPAPTTYLCGATTPIPDAKAVSFGFGEPTWVRDDPDEG